MRKRILFVLPMLCAALAMLLGTALAEEESPWEEPAAPGAAAELLADGSYSGTCGKNLTWILDGSGVLTISGTGDMNAYGWRSAPWYRQRDQVKSVVLHSGVTSISGNAFSECTSLTRAAIPDGVTSIGGSAFSKCTSLTSVVIPDSVTYMGVSVFDGCTSLNSAVLSGSAARLYQYMFRNCTSLASVTIPGSVTSIDYNAFENCTSLTNVTILGSTLSMGHSVFKGCTKLTSAGPIGGGYSIEFGWTDSLPQNAFSDCASLTSVTIPDSITSIQNSAFYGCTSLARVRIPGSVTSVGSLVFMGCANLTSAGPIGGGYDIEFGWTDQIPARAFSNCTGLTSVVIPESITSIGRDAFSGCIGLTSVTIPGSVASIGETAFSGCASLTSVTIPGSGSIIMGSSVFSGCANLTSAGPIGGGYSIEFGWTDQIPGSAFRKAENLVSVTIPDNITKIGVYAFDGCRGLTSVTIPGSVINMEKSVFSGCASLTSAGPSGGGYSIEFGWTDKIPNYAFDEAQSLTSVTIPGGITSIGDCAFDGCTGLTSVTIPGSVVSMGKPVFSGCASLTSAGPIGGGYGIEFGWTDQIPGNAFNDAKSLASVTIPGSITAMGVSVFSGCVNLTSAGPIGGGYSIEFGWTDQIPGNAFRSAENLVSVTIPDGITSIGDSAFSSCAGLTSVRIPGSVASIGENAFSYCRKLANMKLPDHLTSIGSYAFQNCAGLTSLTIPGSVTSIGTYVFSGCTGLASLTISDGVTSLGDFMFSGCTGLTGVTIPGSVTGMGTYVFSGCTGLTGVTISDGVTSIGDSMFYGCTGLTSVTIPDSITGIPSSLYDAPFRECPGLTSAGPAGGGYNIEFGWRETIPAHAFTYNSSLVRVVIPDGITRIGDYAFYNCTGLTSVSIPGSVTSIGGYAFQRCEALTSVTIPGSVTSMGSSVFSCCTSLTSVTISDGVTSIGNYMFSECTGLTSVTIPESITSVGSYAFQHCDGLTSAGPIGGGYSIEFGWTETIPDNMFTWFSKLTRVVLPDGITDIGKNEFSSCTELTSVRIPGSVTSIGEGAFSYCRKLANLKLPEHVASIGGSAFQNCASLTSLTIPGGVTSIGTYMFSGCTGLTSMTIPASVTGIGSCAFYNCTGLTSVTIPASVTSIGSSAFYNCTGLTDVYYAGTEEQWNAVQKGSSNPALAKAAIHCNSAGPEQPVNPEQPELPGNAKQELVFFGSGSWDKGAQTYTIARARGSLSGNIVVSQDTVLEGTEFIEDLLRRYICVDYVEEEPSEGTVIISAPHRALRIRPVEVQVDKAASAARMVLDDQVLSEQELSAGTGILEAWDGRQATVGETKYDVLADAASSMPAKGSTVGFCLIRGSGVIVEISSRSYETKIGTLSSYNETAGTAVINGQEYPVNGLECEVELPPFVGKEVFFLLANGEIVHMDELENAAYRLKVSLKQTTQIGPGSNSAINITYKNGAFSSESCLYTVTLSNQTVYSYPERYKRFYNQDLIDTACEKTSIELDSAVWDLDAGLQADRIIVSGVTLLPGQSVERECTVFLTPGYRPSARSETLKGNLCVTCRRTGQGTGLLRASRGISFTVNNLDYKKTPPAQSSGSTPARASAARAAKEALDKLPRNLLGLNMNTMKQLFGIEGTALERLEKELLTAVVLSDIPEETLRDKVEDKVLSKVFGKYKPDVSTGTYTVQLFYGIQTPSYGTLTVRFDCRVQAFGLSGSTFSKTISVEYEILDPPSGIPQTSGSLGGGVSVDTKAFQDAAYSLVEQELKSAFNSAWGDDAEQVAQFLFGQTLQDILNAADTSVKDITWSLLVWPSKNLTASCPVDVRIYDGDGKLLGAVENNVVTQSGEDFQLWVEGDVKHITGLDLDCSVQYTATDSGYMNVEVTENYGDGLSLRQISHYDVPLEKGFSYEQSVSANLQQPKADYDLIASDTRSRLQADEDVSLFTPDVDPSLGELEMTDWAVTGDHSTVIYLRGDQSVLGSGCTVLAARYDEEGRLSELTTGEIQDLCVTFDRPLSEEWSVFLADSACRPLMEKPLLSPDLRGA